MSGSWKSRSRSFRYPTKRERGSYARRFLACSVQEFRVFGLVCKKVGRISLLNHQECRVAVQVDRLYDTDQIITHVFMPSTELVAYWLWIVI